VWIILETTLEVDVGKVILLASNDETPCARRQTNGQSVPQVHPANPSRALVRVDGAGIRKKIKKDYEKALRDLENSRREDESKVM